MSDLFLNPLPEKVSSKTRLTDIFITPIAFKAFQENCLTVSDLVKLIKKDELGKVIASDDDRKALTLWLSTNGLIRNTQSRKKDKEKPSIADFPPNPRIVPLEKIRLDIGLDGRGGTNRGDDSKKSLEASDDLSAVKAWLSARAGNVNTQGVYRKEAERFLLWCTVEKDIAMSSVGVQEAAEYLRWLEELGRLNEKDWAKRWKNPQHDWIGAKNTPRDNDNWRPFAALCRILQEKCR